MLFIAYYASAEIGCHLALGWPVPARILDLFTEFRNHTNGLPTTAGNGLVGALAHFGIDSIGAEEKDEMRALVLRGGPWTEAEKTAILDYCVSDVAALARLLPRLLPRYAAYSGAGGARWNLSRALFAHAPTLGADVSALAGR